MQRCLVYVTVDFMEAQYTSTVRAREWQLAHTPILSMTRGEVWYFMCLELTMPVVRVRIVAVGVCTPQCSCHPHGVCYTRGEWRPVVHIDGDERGENVVVSQPGRLRPDDCLACLIAAASRRRGGGQKHQTRWGCAARPAPQHCKTMNRPRWSSTKHRNTQARGADSGTQRRNTTHRNGARTTSRQHEASQSGAPL